jgi:nitrogenase-associated protein
MKIVIFYEKPGCATNARQKKSLRDAGCMVIERDLLEHGMNREELQAYLKHKPLTQWFNPAAPRIKSGEINPAMMNEEAALQMLMREPILINRPLMVISGRKLCGFEQEYVETLLGRPLQAEVVTACSGKHETCADIAIKF